MLIAINLYIFKSNYKNEYGLYWVFVEPNQSCKRMPQIHQVILLLIPITWFSIAKESKINNIRVLWAVLTISPTQKEGSWSVGAYKWLIHIGAGSSVPWKSSDVPGWQDGEITFKQTQNFFIVLGLECLTQVPVGYELWNHSNLGTSWPCFLL